MDESLNLTAKRRQICDINDGKFPPAKLLGPRTNILDQSSPSSALLQASWSLWVFCFCISHILFPPRDAKEEKKVKQKNSAIVLLVMLSCGDR